MKSSSLTLVPETRIGFWFLGTQTWTHSVIRVALNDLERLIPERRASYPVVLDAGCGQGKSLRPLIEHFNPEVLIGVDADERALERARDEAARFEARRIDLRCRDLASLGLPDASVDLLFCHQTFHHLTRQDEALDEFFRVLRPGGVLLFAESTRAYIHSWIIRLLFRHPMEMQRSAAEYMEMIRRRGFQFRPENTSFPYLWWSRSDLGAREWWGFGVPRPGEREETLINLAARKPS